MTYEGNGDEFLQLETLTPETSGTLKDGKNNELTILWNIENNASLIIDGIQHKLPKNRLIFLTEFHKTKIRNIKHLRFLRFNKPFYCIIDHDSEVGCKGILFFGASEIPVIQIPESELDKFETLWSMFTIEMQSKDDLQLEMLQVLLKRLLILCTRCYKNQRDLNVVQDKRLDVIREFHYLVEKYFKEHHDVGFYADKLYKSPKTLSNLFAAGKYQTPLQTIHTRIILEAKRQLIYTDKPIKAVAYELGYGDVQTFGRFFRTKENISPAQYRKTIRYKKPKEILSTYWENVPTF